MKHFTKYIGNPKEVKLLNEKLIKGNLETFNFYEGLSRGGTSGKLPSVLKTVDMNKLWQGIISPTSGNVDYSSMLKILSSSTQGLPVKLYPGASFGVSKDLFNKAERSGRLTTNAYYSMLFGFQKEYNQYNDFDTVWSEGFDKKVTTAFNEFEKMFKKVPEGDFLKIGFLGRTTTGIDARYKISTKKDGFPTPQTPYGSFIQHNILFNTDFDGHEITFNPNDDSQRSEAIVSMLVLMIMEPNVFVNIKVGPGSETLTPGDNFLNLDIYDLYDNSILQEGNIRERVDGAFVWSDTSPGAALTEDAFKAFKADFKKIFQYRDIMHFVGFNNHERDSTAITMFDYIKDKIFNHFYVSGKLTEDSTLFDPRSRGDLT